MHSQSILKEERVKTFTEKGVKYIGFNEADAKLILKDVLEKEVLDSLINEYMYKDKSQTDLINLQSNIIYDLKNKDQKSEQELKNLSLVVNNNSLEISKLNQDLITEKKEVKKQKLLKKLGFALAVILPVSLIVFTN